jgi:hypothetical protein
VPHKKNYVLRKSTSTLTFFVHQALTARGLQREADRLARGPIPEADRQIPTSRDPGFKKLAWSFFSAQPKNAFLTPHPPKGEMDTGQNKSIACQADRFLLDGKKEKFS